MKKLVLSLLPLLFLSLGNFAQTAPYFTSTPILTATEDVLYSYTATASDDDLLPILIFTAPTLPSWLDFNEITQELSGTPLNEHVGDHPVVIRVFDGLFEVFQSFTITVSNVNDAPIFTSTPILTATEDVLYSYTATASDVDETDVLTFSAPTLPIWLDFDEDTQELFGTPLNEHVGIHPVVIRVNDGTVDVDQSFSITVSNENDAPVFTSTPIITASEDVLYSYTATASDDDLLDILTFSAPTLPIWLDFDEDTQELFGTPLNEHVGIHPVVIRVNDGTVDVDQSFSITVGNVNDAPTFTSIPITTAEQGTEYSYTATAEDIDPGDILSFSALELPAWLLFDEDTQVLNGTPGNDDVGDNNVSLMVSDGITSDTQTFVITVGDINDAPVFTSIPITTAEQGAEYSYTATAEDVDLLDILSFSALELPAWLLFDVDTQVLNGTPGNDDVGDHNVSLMVSDGITSDTQTFILVVANVNDAPTFTSIPITTAEQGTEYTYTATAEDIDVDDTLTFSAPVLPAWLNFDADLQVLSGTPGNEHVGDNSVSLIVNDGTVDVVQSFIIDVGNINDPPVFTSTPVTEARPGVAYQYTVTAEDIDGDDLTFTAEVLPGWLTFNPSSQLLSATPSDSDVGDQLVIVRVSDGSLYAEQTFVVTVDYGNHAPNFISDPATVITVGDSYVYTISAYDIDGDELIYSAPVLPDWLTFYEETNVVSGIPRIEDVGTHDVTVRVSDGTVSADQSFPVTVQEENIEPVFTSTPGTSVTEGSLYVYYVTAEDGNGDDLSFSATLLPDWLNFDPLTGILHGTPDSEDIGDHNVTISVSDGDATIDQNFTITVEVRSGVGIFDLHSPEFLVVYPNPSTGRFILAFAGEFEKELQLEIIDPLGKVLIKEVFPAYQLIREEYNLGDRPDGMYFIRVFHESDQIIRKLILQ